MSDDVLHAGDKARTCLALSFRINVVVQIMCLCEITHRLCHLQRSIRGG